MQFSKLATKIKIVFSKFTFSGLLAPWPGWSVPAAHWADLVGMSLCQPELDRGIHRPWESRWLLVVSRETRPYCLTDQSGTTVEFELWCVKWNDCDDPPKTVIETLEKCEAAFFPNINVLLRIFATLPDITCTPERSFSVLQILKTHMLAFYHARGKADRDEWHCYVYLHSDFIINIEEVINCFAVKNCRLTFNV